MKQVIAPLLMCSGFAIFRATAFSADEQAEAAPLLSRLKVGQREKLAEASGGYEFGTFNARNRLDEIAADFVPRKVVQVGPDSTTVDLDRGMEQTIAAHAIVALLMLRRTSVNPKSRIWNPEAGNEKPWRAKKCTRVPEPST